MTIRKKRVTVSEETARHLDYIRSFNGMSNVANVESAVELLNSLTSIWNTGGELILTDIDGRTHGILSVRSHTADPPRSLNGED